MRDADLTEKMKVELLKRLEQHLESANNLGVDLGEDLEMVNFLASLRDMALVEGLLIGFNLSKQEREWLFNMVEEEMGKLPKGKRGEGYKKLI